MSEPASLSEERLKPCPFCGGDAIVRDADEHTQFYVACQTLDCYCCVGESYDRDAMPDHVFRSAEDAAAAWNHRSQGNDAAGASILRLPLTRDPRNAFDIVDGNGSTIGSGTTPANVDALLLACNSRNALVSALNNFVAAAKSWHTHHHGNSTIQCDWLCECIPDGESALKAASGAACVCGHVGCEGDCGRGS
jgi:hypothetical protein